MYDLAMTQTVLVHDNFVQAGGGERVFEELARCFPDADIVSTVAVKERLSPYLKGRTVKTSWMQHLPAIKRLYRHYFFAYPAATRSLDLSRYSRVISSCYGFAKMARKAQGAIHICYCHTPTRWIWRFDDYVSRETFGTAALSALRVVVSAFRRADLRAAAEVDFFIANSLVVAERIREYYGREAPVIFPPIDVTRFTPSSEIDDSYLVVSRLVGYKRIDLAIQACEQLGRKLLIVGSGPDRSRLEQLAGPNTVFLGRKSDAEVAQLMSRTRALLFPGEEDFGLTPLEVNAAGRPCIAFGAGGAMDTVLPGLNGLHFPEPTAAALVAAILQGEETQWDPARIRAHAERFDVPVFQRRILEAVAAFERQAAGSVPA